MKYFISHSSRDKFVAELLVNALKCFEPQLGHDDIFYSSVPETGSDFKDELIVNINKNITRADNIILIVTGNYLRSSFCFYEMSLARYLKSVGNGKEIIIIAQDEAAALKIDDIFPWKAFLHINASLDDAAATLAKTLGYSDDAVGKLGVFLGALSVEKAVPDTPFIGMSRADYQQKHRFIEKFGIEKIGFDYPSTPEIASERLKDAEHIYFVSTTGTGFLKTYKETLISCAAKGCDISLIIGDKGSRFNADVAEIEAFDSSADYEQARMNNEVRINSEFQATFQYLNEILNAAAKTGNCGRIRCASSYTLIRQTALIARMSNGSYWGWITCTMPPARSADQTPSLLFGGEESNALANIVWKYAQSMFLLAEKRGATAEIDGVSQPERLDRGIAERDFEQMLENAKAYWTQRYVSAQSYMSDCEKVFDEILIEVAAQHPLKNRRVPNKEFEARLNKAVELYNMYTSEGREVKIYVPGSRHKFNSVADEVSLSKAGTDYLLSKGLPAECLFGEAENIRYKGAHGVYNSADECFVASEIFKNGQFDKLVCICSPNQIMRKSMLYIEFGCIPLCYGVTTEKMFHQNTADEIFGSLNRVLYFDHSWQDENSDWFKYFRDTRRPQEE